MMVNKKIVAFDPGDTLLKMDEKTFFTESLMFMFKKTIDLADGKISPEEYQKSKTVVDGMYKARELLEHAKKVIPKFPEKGWLFPYLVKGSDIFDKRWSWWSDCLTNEEIIGEIPQIEFCQYGFNSGSEEVLKHIESILMELERMQCTSSLLTLIKWLLWGFGSKNIEKQEWSEEVDKFLYKKFVLGKLQKYPFDYMAKFAQESRGSSRWTNPTAFYQTPFNVSIAMAQMLFSEEKDITKSVLDPCAGTGTLLLAASNYSVNLYAQEICWDLCLMLEVNGYLYMPWLVKPAKWLKVKHRKCKKGDKRVFIGKKEIAFKKGKDDQLLLFDV